MVRAFILSMGVTLIILIAFNQERTSPPKIEIIKTDRAIIAPNPPHFSAQYLAQQGLNYIGIYQGTLPCADCQGTKITLELTTNGFNRTVTRLGVVHESTKIDTGFFSWDDSGNKIQLELPSKSKYQFIEGNLHQLGINGTECISFKGEAFILKKINTSP